MYNNPTGTPVTDDPNAGQSVPETPAPEAPVTPEAPAETPQPESGEVNPEMGEDQGQNPAGGAPVV